MGAAGGKKRSISFLSDDSDYKIDDLPSPSSCPKVTKLLAANARAPNYGLVMPSFPMCHFAHYDPPFTPWEKPDCGPLNMKLVPEAVKKHAENKAKKVALVSQPVVKNNFGTIRVFGSTVRACQGYLSKRGSGDLATQVYFWDAYKRACRLARTPRGKFVNPDVAEFLVGLPRGWTSPDVGAVSMAEFCERFPEHAAAKDRAVPVVSLFAGVGGLELGMSSLVRPTCFVEKDPWCQRVLAARMRDGFFEKVPIISDVCDFRPSSDQSQSKGLLAGFPCQGICKAGNKQGLEDPRSNLVCKVFDIIDIMPDLEFAWLENVAHLLSAEMRDLLAYVLQEFLKRGFAVRWCVVTGRMAGFHVKRDRIFIYAGKTDLGTRLFQDVQVMTVEKMIQEAHRCHHFGKHRPPLQEWLARVQSENDRMRLKAIGNIVIPRCARLAAHIIAHAHQRDGIFRF